jgi:hypothetical protein
MHPKRPFLAFSSKRNPQKQLESMYARRCALDAVIQSLEEYNRFRVRRPEPIKQKSA